MRTCHASSTITKLILKDTPVYSELISTSIERWHETRDNIKIKPCRKINKQFEAAVWGRMMICETEEVTLTDYPIVIFYFSIFHTIFLLLADCLDTIQTCLFEYDDNWNSVSSVSADGMRQNARNSVIHCLSYVNSCDMRR